MLQEAQAEAEAGRDVVIGYLEPHGRAATAAQAEGLAVVPRRRVTYRDTALEEMDLPAVLERAPELCLIDELAHTNPPGLEHAKRFEDVQDVLEAGIDVFSTVNVQHLESLNDQVAELTGVRVRETLPDARARRGRRGRDRRPHPQALSSACAPARSTRPSACRPRSNNFFRGENLAALREVALRQVAERVEAHRLAARARSARPRIACRAAAPQAVGERLLALVTPEPRSQRHRAPRVALGPAARRRARPAVGLGSRARAARPRSASRSRRCGGWRPCSARTC